MRSEGEKDPSIRYNSQKLHGKTSKVYETPTLDYMDQIAYICPINVIAFKIDQGVVESIRRIDSFMEKKVNAKTPL